MGEIRTSSNCWLRLLWGLLSPFSLGFIEVGVWAVEQFQLWCFHLQVVVWLRFSITYHFKNVMPAFIFSDLNLRSNNLLFLRSLFKQWSLRAYVISRFSFHILAVHHRPSHYHRITSLLLWVNSFQLQYVISCIFTWLYFLCFWPCLDYRNQYLIFYLHFRWSCVSKWLLSWEHIGVAFACVTHFPVKLWWLWQCIVCFPLWWKWVSVWSWSILFKHLQLDLLESDWLC